MADSEYICPSEMISKFISTNYAINYPVKYLAVSYVKSQYTDLDIIKNMLAEYFDKKNMPYDDVYVWMHQISDSNICNSNINTVYGNAWRTLALVPEVDNHDIAKIILTDRNVFKSEQQVEKLFSRAIRDHAVCVIARSLWFNRACTLQAQLLSDNLDIIIDNKLYEITDIIRKLLILSYKGEQVNEIYKYMIKIQRQKGIGYDKISEIEKLYERENWDYFVNNEECYIFLKDSEILIDNLRRRGKASSISLMEAFRLIGSRTMNKDYARYEPIEAICKNGKVINIKDKYCNIPLHVVTSFSRRSQINNLCWMPTRLQVHNGANIYNHRLYIDRKGTLIASEGQIYIKERDHDNLYYLVGTNCENKNMYIKLKKIDIHYNKSITHFIDMGVYENLTKYSDIDENNIIEIGTMNRQRSQADDIKTRSMSYSDLVRWSDKKRFILKDMIYRIVKNKDKIYRNKNQNTKSSIKWCHDSNSIENKKHVDVYKYMEKFLMLIEKFYLMIWTFRLLRTMNL